MQIDVVYVLSGTMTLTTEKPFTQETFSDMRAQAQADLVRRFGDEVRVLFVGVASAVPVALPCRDASTPKKKTKLDVSYEYRESKLLGGVREQRNTRFETERPYTAENYDSIKNDARIAIEHRYGIHGATEDKGITVTGMTVIPD